MGKAHQTLANSGRVHSHVFSDVLLAKGGHRKLREMRQAHRAKSLPSSLPAVMSGAVAGAFGTQGRPAAPLPISVDQLHVRQRGATHSVQCQSLQGWLASDHGKAWQNDRARLYAADEHTIAEGNL